MIHVDGREVPWREGLTVADLMAGRAMDASSVFVDLNGALVPPREWAARPVPDGARVRLHPVAWGG